MAYQPGNVKIMEGGSNGRMTSTALAGDPNLIHLHQRKMIQNPPTHMSAGNGFATHPFSERVVPYAQGFHPQRQ
jgi:hypothetical protein